MSILYSQLYLQKAFFPLVVCFLRSCIFCFGFKWFDFQHQLNAFCTVFSPFSQSFGGLNDGANGPCLNLRNFGPCTGEIVPGGIFVSWAL